MKNVNSTAKSFITIAAVFVMGLALIPLVASGSSRETLTFMPDSLHVSLPEADISAGLADNALNAFTIDLSNEQPVYWNDRYFYRMLGRNINLYKDIATDIDAALLTAATGQGFDVVSVEESSWKAVAGLHLAYGKDYTAHIGDFISVEVEKTETGYKGYVSGVTYGTVKGTDAQEGYFYTNSVYADDGTELTYAQTNYIDLSEDYLSGILFPLTGYERCLKDGWFKSRDLGYRRHLGTDIKVPANTPILSCTDGTVTAIGYGAIPGNYIDITDSSGMIYGYYHMIRKTDFLKVGDFVKKGDLVGHVGNTGNSAANHLHLAVIDSTEGRYINSFSVLMQYYIKK